MSRLKVTPKGKVKKNIPVTRIGKRQYLKRRFAHVRAIDVAGLHNHFTQKYFDRALTPAQSFTRLGLAIDPSATGAVVAERQRRVRPHTRRRLEEETQLQEAAAAARAGAIGRPVSEQEGTTMANLLRAYGTNFKRMTLDAKLNPFQLTARQLQRQAVNYLRWQAAAFPREYAEAQAQGWLPSTEQLADPALRRGQQLPQPLPSPSQQQQQQQQQQEHNEVATTTKKAAKAKKQRR